MSSSTDVLEAAARWYVQLNDENAGPADQRAWQHWLNADASHRRAWQQMQALAQRLDQLPADIALPTLSGVKSRRRRLTRLLTMLLGAGTLAWVAYDRTPWRTLVAGYRTGAGERRRFALADGSALELNTRTAVDVDFGPSLRLLRLHAGEILVQTALDLPARRPFEVRTAEGRIRALGTRFTVLAAAGRTRVAVLQDAVEIRPARSATEVTRLEAGRQAEFTEQRIVATGPADPARAEWVNGKLIAIDRRLGDFIAELARHRSGYLGCDPTVADLRISGAFRLDDTDAILANVAASLPVTIRYATRYWVSVEGR
ncbi:MAG: FecR domain-containing protein [Burkholderiaceae bacterium]